MSDDKRDPFTVSNASGVLQPTSPLSSLRQRIQVLEAENADLRTRLHICPRDLITFGYGAASRPYLGVFTDDEQQFFAHLAAVGGGQFQVLSVEFPEGPRKP